MKELMKNTHRIAYFFDLTISAIVLVVKINQFNWITLIFLIFSPTPSRTSNSCPSTSILNKSIMSESIFNSQYSSNLINLIFSSIEKSISKWSSLLLVVLPNPEPSSLLNKIVLVFIFDKPQSFITILTFSLNLSFRIVTFIFDGSKICIF